MSLTRSGVYEAVSCASNANRPAKALALGRYVTGLGLHGIIHTAIGRCNQLCDLYEPVTHSLWQPLQLLSVLL